MILEATVLFERGPKQYSQFTVDRPAKLSGQLLDPQGAAVANLRLVPNCDGSTAARVTDSAGDYDFGILEPGKIGTPAKVWLPPEVKCDERGCSVEKLRLGPISLTSLIH